MAPWLLTLGLGLAALTPDDLEQRARTPAPTTAATISGVVHDDAGRPAVGVRVTATSRSAGLARAARTDASGRYALVDLPPGAYTVTAAGPGFASRRFGQTSAGGPGVPVPVTAASDVTADFNLERLSAVAGTVLDEHGLPIPLDVTLYTWTTRRGIRALAPVATTRADRHGRYRFDSVRAGTLLVATSAPPEDLAIMTAGFLRQAEDAVSSPGSPIPDADSDLPTVSYVRSFFPGVASPHEATPVVVPPGQEISGVDLRVLRLPTTIVEGTVVEADGTPAEGRIVVLVSRDQRLPSGLPAATGRDGRFRIGTVPHGSYHLTLGTASTPVTAVGPRVSGVRLELPPEVEIQGRVEYAGRTSPPLTRSRTPVRGADGEIVLDEQGQPRHWDVEELPRLTLMLQPLGEAIAGGVPGPSEMLIVDQEGHVAGSVAPGTYTATVAEDRLADGWHLDSIRVDGDVDLLDTPLTIAPGRSTLDLVITYIDTQTRITGQLTHPDGTPEPGVLMLAFSAEPRFWTADSRRVMVARPDTNGRYVFEGLPPGDFLIAAITDFDTGNGIGADILESLAPHATSITLGRGETTNIDFAIGRRD